MCYYISKTKSVSLARENSIAGMEGEKKKPGDEENAGGELRQEEKETVDHSQEKIPALVR